jgi:hypothetical protein
MTMNRDPFHDDIPRRTEVNRYSSSTGISVAIALIVAIGLLFLVFSGDRTTTVRDTTTSTPNVAVERQAPGSPDVTVRPPSALPPAAPGNTGAAPGTAPAPGTGQ